MSITPEQIAARLAAIAHEHGVPNGAGLDEVAGAHQRLAVANVLRWRLGEVNAVLSGQGLQAAYHREPGAAARISIELADANFAEPGGML